MVGFTQTHFGLKVVLEVSTKALTQWHLTDEHLALKNLILSLHKNGLTDSQIAIYLTTNQIASKRGKIDWQAKNVWSVRKRFAQRADRSTHNSFRFSEVTLQTPLGDYEIKHSNIEGLDIKELGNKG